MLIFNQTLIILRFKVLVSPISKEVLLLMYTPKIVSKSLTRKYCLAMFMKKKRDALLLKLLKYKKEVARFNKNLIKTF
jgi:hypothetical protein